MSYENKSSIEYRVKIGELPQPDIVREYYIEQNHSYKDSMTYFNMSKSTWENYIKRYDIKKGINPILEQKLKRIEKIENKSIDKEEINEKEKAEAEQDLISEQKIKEREKEKNNINITSFNYDEVSIDKRYKELIAEDSCSFDIVENVIFQICFEFDIFYNVDTLKDMFEQDPNKLPLSYLWKIQTTEKFKDFTFFKQLKRENFEKIYSEDILLLSLSDEDKKNRQQIISIIGYDPFLEDNPEDRPQLYRDLTDLLSENMRKDAAKKKAAVEVVHNYLNISKYQKKAKMLMDSGDIDSDVQKSLDGYLGMITKIQTSINQTTKENGFSGGRSIGSNGHGMLSDVMNQVEEQGYDKGITNFYDIATSASIAEIGNISFKALLNQVQLSKTDYADIMAQQAVLVRDAQKKAREVVEALRIAKEKLTKQDLLIELEKDYRKKGINEEEIKEFIAREYDLYEVN